MTLPAALVIGGQTKFALYFRTFAVADWSLSHFVMSTKREQAGNRASSTNPN